LEKVSSFLDGRVGTKEHSGRSSAAREARMGVATASRNECKTVRHRLQFPDVPHRHAAWIGPVHEQVRRFGSSRNALL
jgi:hypothetical protein